MSIAKRRYAGSDKVLVLRKIAFSFSELLEIAWKQLKQLHSVV